MIGRLYSRYRVVCLAAGVLALAGAALIVRPGLRRDYNLNAFVASGDPAYAEFQRFTEEFTSNEIALIAVRSEDAMSDASLRILEGLVAEAKKLYAVEHVGAITEIPLAIRALMGDRLRTHPLIEGNLLSADGRTATVVMQMRGGGSDGTERKRTVAKLRGIVAAARSAHPDVAFYLAGPYVTLIDMYEYVDRDLVVFTAAVFALLALTLWLVFRRVGPMAFAIGCAASAVLVTLGVAAVVDLNVSLVVQMIVILVTVLTVANAVHLSVGGEEEARDAADERSRATLAARTLRRLAAPCAAVTLTTSAGFGSVMVSQITPVRVFGLLMVIGLAVGLCVSFALLPTVFAFGRPVREDTARLAGRLERVGTWSLGRSRAVVVCFVVLAGVAAAGTYRLRFESDFVKNFRAESEVRRSYAFIERHLTPLGAMEVVIRETGAADLVTPDRVRAADELGAAVVAEHEPLRKSMSLADLITLSSESLPSTALDLRLRLAAVSGLVGEGMLRSFLNADQSAMRINLRAIEGYAVDEKLAMADSIRRRASETFGGGFETTVTGLYYFYAQLVSGLVRDQYRSFGITLSVVFVALIVVLRSLRLAAVLMIPNLLPVLGCLGAMAWLSIPVNMTTVMMLSVTFGIAVDDTLHYSWRCRREFSQCGDHKQAVLRTHRSVGRACLFTTVVIAGGFWILILSRFLPTAYFGGLVGFTMLCALAADLVLLPVLIVWARPFGGKVGR